MGFDLWLAFFLYLQYPDYIDANLRLAAIAKARNNILLSIELVTIILLSSLFSFVIVDIVNVDMVC